MKITSQKSKLVAFLFILLPLIKANAINLDFSDNTLISCNHSDNDEGKYCIYNVASGVYAKVKLVKELNADVTHFDDNNYGEDKAFQPIVIGIKNKDWGYGDFEITFWKDSSATQPLYLDLVQATAVDVDGDGSGSEKEGAGFFNFISYTLESNTNLDSVRPFKKNNLYRFSSSNYTNQPGIDYTKTENMVSVLYKKVHLIKYRAYVYNNLDSGNTSGRLFSIYFGDSYNGNPFPNWSNPQTTKVGISILGRIIEDINGDGQIDSTDVGINNITVKAYMDDGDSNPENSESYKYKITTGEYNGKTGFYSFTVPINKTYWIAVNSKDIPASAGLNSSFSRGDIWAEQTYGGNYVLCDTDANSSTAPVQLTQGGACFGGRNGDKSDGFYDDSLSKAEHLAKIDANTSDITDVDFGFSFNVVTNINDQDDEDIDGNNRTCQGCLRQFIQNANAISGPNAMRFVPTIPMNESNWWKIILNITAGASADSDDYSLPPITDDFTIIDGTAYDYQNGTSVRDTNAGTSGHSGEKVGVGDDGLENTGDEAKLPNFNKPELEIDIDGRGFGFTIKASNITIRNIAIQHSDDDKPDTALIRVENGIGNLVEGCFIGTKADGSDPNTNSRLGINTFHGTTTDIRDNYIAYLSDTGIQMEGEGVVEYNDIYRIGYSNECGDGISTEFISNHPTGTRDKSKLVFRYNRIEKTAAYGIDTWKYPGAMTSSNNTILNTGQGNKDGNLCGNSSTGFEQGGIRVFGIGNEIKENLIHDVPGNGIVLASIGNSTKQNLISKNVFYNTGGISIDIDLTHTGSTDNPNGDGVTPNNGVIDDNKINIELDYPVITLAEVSDGTLHITGYIGTSSQKITGDHKIEIYKSDDDGNNNGEIEQGDGKSVAHGDGKYYLGPCITKNDGTFDCYVSISNVNLSNGDTITATAIDSNNNTSEFGPNTRVQISSNAKTISGHIYEDLNGDGDPSDKKALENVVVKLYDSSGTELETAVTNAKGEFSFSVSANGDYYIAVDSKSILPSAGFNSGYNQSDVWAEQTYGPAGSYCDKDANSSTDPLELSKADVCFGGKNGNKSDGLNDGNGNYDFTKAEHVAKVTVSDSDVSGLDFGFSFNVVTNVNDTDEDPNNSRTCQGCFRQFIQNANAISGQNTLRFVPTVQANKTNYWSITTDRRMSDSDPYSTDNTEPIFRIEDKDTTIDGTAYSYKDGTTIVDKNSGTIAGKTVGYLNTCSIDAFSKPELEIFTNARYIDDNNESAAWDPYNNGASASIFYVKGSNFKLKNISAYGGHYVVFVDEANNPKIKDNFLGIPASGLKDPGEGKRSNRGVAVTRENPDNTIGLVEHNLIGYTRLHGIFTYKFDGQNNFIIRDNIVSNSSRGWNHENGIGLEEGTQRIKVTCNYVDSSCGVGIETWKSNGEHTIESNTVESNGLECAENTGGEEKIGIRITSSDNIIRYNKIINNKGPGLMVAYDRDRGFNPERNLISQNSFENNEKVGIDLLKNGEDIHGIYPSGESGVTPNNGQKDTDIGNKGLDYPVLTLASLSEGKLHLEGYIGKKDNKLKPLSGKTWIVEIYKAKDDGNNNGEIEEGDGKSVAHGEGYEYLGSITLSDTDFNSKNNFSKDLAVSGLSVGDKITAITIDESNNTSEFGGNTKVVSNVIYGYIYHDGYNPENQSFIRPNGNKDSYEEWKDKNTAPTVYIKLCDKNGNVVDVKEISDGDGFYKFENVQNGVYILVEDTDNNTNNCSPSDPSQWISTTPNSINVTINNRSINVNFGDFHGSKITGYVFDDKGDGTTNSSYANNGLFNSSVEKGIKGVEVKVCQSKDCSSFIDKTETNKDGEYTLYIPYDSNYEGKTFYVVEKDNISFISTGNTKDNISSYKNPNNSTVEERNIIDFVNNAGNTYNNYNFGDVKKVNIQPEHSYTVPSGSSLTIKHTVTINSPGKISVSLISEKNLVYLVYDDPNCDGKADGNPINPVDSLYSLNSGNSISADTNYCLILKTVIPTDIQDGSVDKLKITVFENWINTEQEIDDNDLVTDTITIASQENGLIYLEKVVKNVSQNGNYSKRNQAKPCDVLEYKISFKNIGSRKVKELVISDNIPITTEFKYASYNGKDVKVVFGNDKYTGNTSDNPDIDGITLENDALKVNVNKVIGKEFIEPGEEGYILYQVKIKGNNCE